MTQQIEFVVIGTPVPQGSMRSFGRGRMVHQNSKKLHEWRDNIAKEARKKIKEEGWDFPEKNAPIDIEVQFFLPRPKSRKNSVYHTTRPDLDKLMRAVGDALTEVLFEDDSQIDAMTCSKAYILNNTIPRCIIKVAQLKVNSC